jgi:ammonia channel protein AmtB
LLILSQKRSLFSYWSAFVTPTCALTVVLLGFWLCVLRHLRDMKVVDRFSPLRVSPKEEEDGLDISRHGEEAYHLE